MCQHKTNICIMESIHYRVQEEGEGEKETKRFLKELMGKNLLSFDENHGGLVVKIQAAHHPA